VRKHEERQERLLRASRHVESTDTWEETLDGVAEPLRDESAGGRGSVAAEASGTFGAALLAGAAARAAEAKGEENSNMSDGRRAREQGSCVDLGVVEEPGVASTGQGPSDEAAGVHIVAGGSQAGANVPELEKENPCVVDGGAVGNGFAPAVDGDAAAAEGEGEGNDVDRLDSRGAQVGLEVEAAEGVGRVDEASRGEEKTTSGGKSCESSVNSSKNGNITSDWSVISGLPASSPGYRGMTIVLRLFERLRK
jgi:hypothetical protein